MIKVCRKLPISYQLQLSSRVPRSMYLLFVLFPAIHSYVCERMIQFQISQSRYHSHEYINYHSIWFRTSKPIHISAAMFLAAGPTFHSSVEWVDKPFSVHWSTGQCIIWCPRLQKMVKGGFGGFEPVNVSEKVSCAAAQKPSTLTTRPGRQGRRADRHCSGGGDPPYP